jgi:hypothetical protein
VFDVGDVYYYFSVVLDFRFEFSVSFLGALICNSNLLLLLVCFLAGNTFLMGTIEEEQQKEAKIESSLEVALIFCPIFYCYC